MKPVITLVAAAAITLFSIGAAPAKRVNWSYVVSETPQGSHLIGNPQAEVKIVEYVSYTCPHCSEFETQSGVALDRGYVSSGKVSVEVRSLVRDPVDLAAALLATCGPVSKFKLNHLELMFRQPAWLKVAQTASEGQRKRWVNGTLLQRMRAIASDLKLYELIQRHGYQRADLDRCLADQTAVDRLMGLREGGLALGVQGTPTLLINGEIRPAIHEWQYLDAALREALMPKR